MNIIFFGSDDFALVNFKRLLRSSHRVAACVTQGDKPKGRHLHTAPTAAKEFAATNKIPVLQPKDLKDADFIKQLKTYDADLFVVIAYGRILPEGVLALPKKFSINVHPSLLPKYRGAAPVNWAIINGDASTGVSVIKLNKDVDAGEIIAQTEMKIAANDTSLTLEKKLADAGSELLIKALDSIENNSFVLAGQESARVTPAPKLKKEDGLIHWKDNAADIHNRIRGLLPWPGAFTFFNGKILKILEADLVATQAGNPSPGTILNIEKNGIVVSTGNGTLLLKQVHLESARPMGAQSFCSGHHVKLGMRLG